MFDNGSFLRRRKRYKRTTIDQALPFPASVFGPFNPFWVRKPVPIFPIQFNIDNNVGNILSNGLQENFDLMAGATSIDSVTLKENHSSTFLRGSGASDISVNNTFYVNPTNIDLLRHNINVLRNNPNNITEIDFHAIGAGNTKNELFLNFNQKSIFKTSSENLSRLTSEMFGTESQNDQYHQSAPKNTSFEKINVEDNNTETNNDIHLSDTEFSKNIIASSFKLTKDVQSFQDNIGVKNSPPKTSNSSKNGEPLSTFKIQSQYSDPRSEKEVLLAGNFEQMSKCKLQQWSYYNQSSQAVKRSFDRTSNLDYDYELQKKVTNIRNAKYFSIENLIGRSINTDSS